MLILDSHCDTPSQIIRRRDLGLDNRYGHVDFPKLRRGGVDASFFALYTSRDLAPDAATRYALEMMAGVYDAIEAHPDEVALACTTQEILRNKEKGLISILLGMENGAPIQQSLPSFGTMYCRSTLSPASSMAHLASPFHVTLIQLLSLAINRLSSSTSKLFICGRALSSKSSTIAILRLVR